jgi:polyisoprenoid-binding protein YceI
MTTWKIDSSHTSATFSVRHMMITNVRGEFQKVSGTVQFDAAAPEKSQIDASIDVASISTREAQRDAHLKSADFFDVENHPQMTFKSKSIRSKGPAAYEVKGDLTIRGTTHEVTVDVEGPSPEHKDPWGGTRIGANATTKIKRGDFGLKWNTALEAGGVLVGEEVTIHLDVELTKS